MDNDEYKKKKELILKELDIGSLWHFTDFRKLKSILEHGLLSRNDCDAKGIKYIDSSNQEVQERREEYHDCVPLFFADNTPMLYTTLNQNKILLELDFKLIIEEDGIE